MSKWPTLTKEKKFVMSGSLHFLHIFTKKLNRNEQNKKTQVRTNSRYFNALLIHIIDLFDLHMVNIQA